MLDYTFWEIFGTVLLLLHAAGLAAAVHALLYSRTPQGAIAWAILLAMFPYVVLPFYLVFGRGKFQGYVRARRAGDSQIDHIARALEKKLRLFRVRTDEIAPKYHALEELARMPFTSHNDANLLINGKTAFDAMFAGIDSPDPTARSAARAARLDMAAFFALLERRDRLTKLCESFLDDYDAWLTSTCNQHSPSTFLFWSASVHRSPEELHREADEATVLQARLGAPRYTERLR